MIPCPSCKTILTETDFQNGQCPNCGVALGGGAVIDPNAAGPGQTIEVSRLHSTIDADSVDLSQIPQLPVNNQTIEMKDDLASDSTELGAVVSPESQAGSTIELSRMQQTIDSDSVDFGQIQVPAPQSQTIEMKEDSESLESDSVQSGPVVLPQSTGSQTIELSRMQQTIDSDSVDFGVLKSPASKADTVHDIPEIPGVLESDSVEAGPVMSPDSQSGSTIELSRMQQTIDSDSIDFDNLQAPPSTAKATVELGDATPPAPNSEKPVSPINVDKATVDMAGMQSGDDSDSVVLGAPAPQSNMGATIDLSTFPKVGDSSQILPEGPRQNDSSIANSPVAQTVDSIDIPVASDDAKKTVSEKRLDVTIDSIEFVKPPESSPRLDATVDSIDLGNAPKTNTGTVHDRNLSQTIDSIDLSKPLKTGTVNERSFQATLDSINLNAQGPKGATIPDRDVMATYDSAEVTSRDANAMDQMWRGANVEKASPRMTIKGREAAQQTTKSSLVIQPRQFRQTKVEEVKFGEADYDLIKMLGQGGMGVVYWARQASIDRNVAIKMLKPDMAKDHSQRNKFLAEAVITGDLDHPNIVPIYDLGKNDEGALFYAMKKVQGTPWDKAINRKTLSENLDILMKVADAVAFAHNRFVVHRDLKPENVMLGDFGEVLVMDWGLALPFGRFEKSRSIQPSVSMGGTPAYMAPEMATGPFDKIGATSDVYLLGAILFEIVTGKPPHTGKDVMKCLFAAAKNEIQPTEKSGELIDIAMKAMATKQSDRYQTVQEFQQAIRDYESHAASIAMAVRAGETLAAAKKSNSYDQFATAVFEYQEALKLWSDNSRAARGVPAAKLAYAQSALHKGDLDLAESLLDVNEPSHADSFSQIEAAKVEREAKQQRLKAARKAVRGLAAAVFIAVSIGLIAVGYQTVQVSKQRDLALSNEQEAKRQQGLAKEQESLAKANEAKAVSNAQEAERQKTKAIASAAEAKRQEAQAIKNAQEADKQRSNAVANAEEAERQKTQAVANADEAKRQQTIAEYEAYVALIGLAAAKIEENAFGYARDLLDQCPEELRNWEWGRLMHMCSQSVQDFDAGAPIDAIAFSPDGKRFATGGWNGMAQIWNVEDGAIVHSLAHRGLYVYAVAFSPDGKFLTTGGSDRSGYLRIWNVETGEEVRTLSGHTDGVVSVKYSKDGKRLLSTSFDNSARIWDVESGRLIKTFLGHTWWVWDADFSPDEKQIVTASQDGTALVWSVESGQHGAAFMGHQGPIYSVAFSSDGQNVATGGADKRVLMWKPADVTAFDFRALVAGDTPPPPKFKEFAGHLAAVRSVEFASDGKLLVSGGHDNAVRIWNPETGEPVKALRGHDSQVRATAFSPDGQWVVSGGHDNHARLWSVAGYAESRVLQGKWLRGHEDAIMAVAFSPTGNQIVTASRDRTARSWDARTGKQTISFEEGHAFLASSAVFDPEGKRLFTSAVDGTARGWDLTTGVQILRFENTGRSAALAVSHNGKWLLTGGNRKGETVWMAQIWDAANGKLIAELPGHVSEVTAVAFSPDDRVCFTGDSNGRGVLWNVESAKEIRKLQWHTSKIAAAVFLADGSRLLTASDDKNVAQWNTSQMLSKPDSVSVETRLNLKHDESVLSMDVVSERKIALTCTNGGKVTLWNLENGQAIRSLPLQNTDVNAVALSRDGRMALTVHANPEERLVRLWDMENARELLLPGTDGNPGPFLDLKVMGGLVWSAIFAPDGNAVVTIGGNEARLWDIRAENPSRRELMTFSPHAAVASVSYSPDGKRIVTGSWDNSARIWNAENGKAELKLLGGHQAYVNSAIFSPDGRYVVTASDDKTAKLWDSKTGSVVRGFIGHAGPVHFATFSPRGEFVLTGSEDKTARLWNTETGELIREFKGHAWGVLHAAFSIDGTRIITGSDDNSAKIWNAATGELQGSLEGHTAAVTSVAFAPDGKRVLTASEDFTAKLWDADNGKEILNLKGHSQELTSIAFSSDGRYALTGSRDGTAILWLTTDWTAQKKEQAGQ